MLYAEIGECLDGDAYALDGWLRKIVKRAFNILINAESHDSAHRAIALAIGGQGSYAKAASLIGAIKLRHPKISNMFHSDAGIRLQRRDADMAEAITRRLVRSGIVVLPIHDSFITAARHEGALVEAMNIAWIRYFGGETQVIPVCYDINDPQREWSGGPGLPPSPSPLPMVLLPWWRGGDLFGGRPFPVDDLNSWSLGVAPLAVRAYLRDEISSLGLRQSDIALRLGISRPQPVNILRGRFGASPRVALGLKTLVLPDVY
jgi:hypothetical protein